MKVVIPAIALPTGGGAKSLVDIADALVSRGHEAELLIQAGMPIRYRPRCRVTVLNSFDSASIPRGDLILTNFYTTVRPCYEAWPHRCVRLCQGFEPHWVKDRNHAVWTYRLGMPTVSISRWLDRQIQRLTGRKGIVVTPGVDPVVFHPPKVRLRNGIPRILYIARDPKGYHMKGFRDFAAAMRLVSRRYRRPLIVDLVCPERNLTLPGVRHRILRPAAAHGMAALYRSADLFVSSSWSEGFGLPVLEAMACGTPVVTTNSGGVMDIVRPNINSMVTPPRNPVRLAQAILHLLRHPGHAHRLAARGRSTANRLTLHRYKVQMVQVLERLNTQLGNR